MAITSLYSMRQKEARGEYPDVYHYDKLPEPLIKQIIHIIDHDFISIDYYYIYNTLCREYGEFELPNISYTRTESSFKKLTKFMLANETEIEQILDVVELCFKYAEKISIDELNTRFKMHGVGYEFVNGQVIRIDSELIHREVIKPTLGFLRDEKYFRGANEEFLKAHEFYRDKKYKQAMTECTKAFESCMKGICEKRGWQYEKTAPAKKLIQTCLDNNLVPDYMQDHLTQLQGLLKSTATPRNKEAAHGQGIDIKEVPEELASYALHLTASNILFLVQCEKKLV